MVNMVDDSMNYIVQFLAGGIFFSLLYYFSKMKNTMVASIIPAFPALYIVGYIYLIYFGGNAKKYTKNTMITFGIGFLFSVITYFMIVEMQFDKLVKNPYVPLCVSSLFFVGLTVVCLRCNLLK